jgi:hypothetical protein
MAGRTTACAGARSSQLARFRLRLWSTGGPYIGPPWDSRQRTSRAHLLAGSMTCGSCGATIAQVSGKNGGYYGCLAAARGACDNKPLVRRTLAEQIIIGAEVEGLTLSRQTVFQAPPVEWIAEKMTRLRARPNRLLTRCGRRFEFFATVETAGIEPASAVA